MSQRSRRDIPRVNYNQLNEGVDNNTSESEYDSDPDREEGDQEHDIPHLSEDEDDNVEVVPADEEDNENVNDDDEENMEVDEDMDLPNAAQIVAAAEEIMEIDADPGVLPNPADIPAVNFGPCHTTRSPDNTIWSYVEPCQHQRRRQFNVVNANPGLVGKALQNLELNEIFQLFITEDIQDTIVTHTNAYASIYFEAYNQVYARQLQWKPTDRVEVIAFLGLLLRAGIERNKDQLTRELWSLHPEKRRPAFSATMSRTRFQNISFLLRFDDVEQRKPTIRNWLRQKMQAKWDQRQIVELPRPRPVPVPPIPQIRHSKLDAIKQIFDPFVGNIQSYFEPGENITVDEMLVRFRGRCPFRVYMPKKPGKYGIKVWAAVDSVSGYVCNLQVYEGKIGNEVEKNLGKRVVLDLTELYTYSGRGITTDNFFTSKSLAEELLKMDTTIVGTIRKSRREIPKPFATPKGKQLLSSEFLHHKNITLVSYVQKKSKAVLLMSTQHHNHGISEEPHQKPQIILDYNRHKGGVDTADQMISRYTCQRPTNKWPSKLFHFIADVAALNTFRIWMAKNPLWEQRNRSRRREFLFQLSRHLVLPQIVRRSVEPLHAHIRESIKIMGVQTEQVAGPDREPATQAVRFPTPRRCYICKRMSRTGCTGCSRSICKEHQTDAFVYCAACRPQQVAVVVPP